jgi:hypothetical protein
MASRLGIWRSTQCDLRSFLVVIQLLAAGGLSAGRLEVRIRAERCFSPRDKW